MTDTTQPPSETLAECPFCGSPDAGMSYSATMQSPEPANRFVECSDCGSAGPYVKVAGDDAAAQTLASASWNTRAALTRRAGGDAGAVERAAGFMRHDGLCAAVGAYGYCDCGMEAAKAALLGDIRRARAVRESTNAA